MGGGVDVCKRYTWALRSPSDRIDPLIIGYNGASWADTRGYARGRAEEGRRAIDVFKNRIIFNGGKRSVNFPTLLRVRMWGGLDVAFLDKSMRGRGEGGN